MGRNTDQELQQSFLEEAQTYLDTLEASLLDLSNRGIEQENMDGALRAAHSIKGGAAMMELPGLSKMAHHLEDFFKILIARRDSIVLDEALETLLLQAVDRLAQVRDSYVQGEGPNPNWWETQAKPVFVQLRQRLGDLKPEDENALLSRREGTNVAAQLFDTEVEPLLQELEDKMGQISAQELCAEAILLAEDLASLGGMIQLDAFVALCDRVKYHLETQPSQVEAITTAAIKAWRRSQALIVVGHTKNLPRTLDGFAEVDLAEADCAEVKGVFVATPTTTDLSELAAMLALESGVEGASAVAEPIPAEETAQPDLSQLAAMLAGTGGLDSSGLAAVPMVPSTEPDAGPDAGPDFQPNVAAELAPVAESEQLSPTTESPEPEIISAQPWGEEGVDDSVDDSVDNSRDRAPVPISLASPSTSKPAPQLTRRATETTVRIPLKLLEQLSDLFGELLITRNALNLRLNRMQSSVELLRDRVQNAEESNYELRTFQDQVTTSGVVPSAQRNASLALTTAAAQNSSSSQLSQHRLETTGQTPYFDILEKDQYGALHLLSQTQMENVVQLQEVATDIDLGLADTKQVARSLNQTIKQLQLKVTQTRMRPLSDLMGRFPRMMRDLSVEYGKSVELKVHGGGTLIDRVVLEALADPLLHLLRNSFDHGVEPPDVRQAQGKPPKGLIEIRAAHRGSQTLIQVRDDGAGINLDKVRLRAHDMGISEARLEQATESELLDLIFEPGFSTAAQVTDLSGRGVGMDVVRTNLQQVRGEVKIETHPGEGTVFTISVPFTLSVLRVLVVESQGLVMAFPTDEIAEMVSPHPELLCESAGQTLLNWNDDLLPIWNLGQSLAFSCPQRSPDTEESPKIDAPAILVLRHGNDWMGLQVDRFWGEQEVAVRPIEGILPLPPGFAGSTILGDGRVVPLVDAEQLLTHMIQGPIAQPSVPSKPLTAPPKPSTASSSPIAQRTTIMVVDDSINVRRFLALNLERVGYRVIQAKDGQDALEKLTKSSEVQAMVCDLEMPRLDGYGVLSELRAQHKWSTLPIIMLTSRSSEKHRSLAMELGASAYFSKPYNEQVLLDSLQSLLQVAAPS